MMRLILPLTLLLVLVGTSAGQCVGDAGVYRMNGLAGVVNALAWFDDGNGARLYAAGTVAVDANQASVGIARLDGSQWTPLPGLSTPLAPGAVIRALCVHDDGSGPALYAGGTFTSIGGLPAQNLARWNGTSWNAVDYPPTVTALTSGVGPAGPALFIAGVDWWLYPNPEGSVVSLIAGQFLAAGIFDRGINDLHFHDEGQGPRLFAAGVFSSVDGIPMSGVVKLDTTGWSSVGGGLGVGAEVNALATFDDGTSSRLVCAGSFFPELGAPTRSIAGWNGTQWSSFGAGLQGQVQALAVHDEGQGPRLWAAGNISASGNSPLWNMAVWDGLDWSTPQGGIRTSDAELGVGVSQGGVRALLVTPGANSRLVAGGAFVRAGNIFARSLAAFRQGIWEHVGTDFSVDMRGISTFQSVDDGGGASLLIGGSFIYAGGFPARGITRFDGGSFTSYGEGMRTTIPGLAAVHAIAVFDDGSGPSIYAAGRFLTAGTQTCNNIARWDGADWQPVGSGVGSVVTDVVYALEVWNDGTGDALYVGGRFATAGGVVCNNIAKWNGATWSALGTGLRSPPVQPWNGYAAVRDLQVFDDDAGEALYVAGAFTEVNGIPAIDLARFAGGQWSAVIGLNASNAPSEVSCLAVHADAQARPKLWIAGGFQPANGAVALQSLVRFNGEFSTSGFEWLPTPPRPLLGTTSLCSTMTEAGPALMVGGLTFSSPAQPDDSLLLEWSGGAWNERGSGLGSFPSAMAIFDRGVGPRLMLGTTGSLSLDQPTLSEFDCGFRRPGLQLAAEAGTGTWILNRGLTIGRRYHHFISTDTCALPGTGPFLGLCSSDWNLLLAQYLLPEGSVPFHFVADRMGYELGPYTGLPSVLVDVVLLEETSSLVSGISSVERILLP